MIALGCDHGGYELMQEVKKHLEERGLEYKDLHSTMYLLNQANTVLNHCLNVIYIPLCIY